MSQSREVHSRIRSSSALTAAAMVIDLIFIAILSRLLTPADYGVVGAATLLLLLFDLFREIGIGTTLIQMREVTEKDERTAWTAIVLMSILVFLLAQLLAKAFAHFMNMPEVEEVLRVLSFVILIQGLSATSQSLLLRAQRASRIIFIEICSKFIAYSTVGLSLALMGYGYWSLVWATLMEVIVRSSLLAITAKPKVRPLLDPAALKSLIGTGGGFTTSRIINFIALRADVTIVGRYLDAASLGAYSRAYKLMSLPADLYAKIADRVVFPAFSRVSDDEKRLRSAYLKGTRLTSIVGLPLTAVIYLTSSEIVLFLLGHKWIEIIPIFSILAVGTYFRLSSRLSAAVLRSTASIRHMVSSQTIYAALTVIGCLFAVQYGVVAVAYAVAIAITISYLIITLQTCAVAKVTLLDYVKCHAHGLVLAVLVAAVTWGALRVSHHYSSSPVLSLALVGLVLSLLGLVLLFTRPRFLLGKDGAEFATLLGRSITDKFRVLRKVKS